MARLLIFADVHANLAAFEAVLEAAGTVDGFLFLGDVIGFGPQPRECVELLRQLCPMIMVTGNHDRRALAGNSLWRGRVVTCGEEWEAWTASQLDAAARRFLQSQPAATTEVINGTLTRVCHNLPNARGYVGATVSDSALSKCLSVEPASLVLFAHSHVVIDRAVNGRRVVNPGSVGQPRDGCLDAAFALWDEHGFSFRRVAYDVDRTITALRCVPMSDDCRAHWEHNYRNGVVEPWTRYTRAVESR